MTSVLVDGAAREKKLSGELRVNNDITLKTTRIEIILGAERSYDIRIGAGLLLDIGKQLRAVEATASLNRAVLITDNNVGALYGQTAYNALESEGFSTSIMTIPAGEQSKSLEVAAELWQALSAEGIGRDAVVIGLGGGVVGDLVGFVASTWMRGVTFVQIPTSLLAMVDSSVGGKTAINLPVGKNLVGSFYQPAYVLCDLLLLDSLPAPEWVNGLAEVAKAAIISSPDFYLWIAKNSEALVAHKLAVLKEAIVFALRFKAEVIVADEHETGLRECLNYGHTFAHALEAVAGYGTVGHGRAVAEGIRFAARLATEAVGAPVSFAHEQEATLEALGLYSPLPEAAVAVVADDLYASMLSDKKNRNGAIRFIFAQAPGQWTAAAVDPDLLKIYLIYWQRAVTGDE